MVVTILMAIRDALIAMALAWVGVTIERIPAAACANNAQACAERAD